MRATLYAGRNILLSDGIMVGGTASATEKIVIQRLGSSAGVPTYISVGIHPKIRIKIPEPPKNEPQFSAPFESEPQ